MTKTTFVVFLCGALMAVFLDIVFNYTGGGLYDDSKEKVNLAVCILSARDHFTNRQTIRHTWLSNQTWLKEKGILAKFVVGNDVCTIHPEDRLDHYSCDLWTPKLTGEGDISAYSVSSGYPVETDEDVVKINRLALKVLHPIVLKRIGVFSQMTSPVEVTLYDGVTDEEITSVSFNNKDRGIEHRGFRYQPIQPLLLPKGFYGELTTNTSQEDRFVFEENFFISGLMSDTNEDVILIEHMKSDRTYHKKSEKGKSLLSFMFSVQDPSSLETHLAHQKERQDAWQEQMNREQKELEQEHKVHKDLLLVDVQDVYRNLPHKVLACHQWFNSHVSAKFVMKTDDDCLVDVDKVLKKLDKLPSANHLWIGNFRDDWLVERHGKWGEREFPSSAYPRFACGSGSVVSSDLHQWLAYNKDHLHKYQGEDVSMGIWLAAVGPTYQQDNLLECSKSCSPGSYVLPELTPAELQELWKRKLKCGDPCVDCPG